MTPYKLIAADLDDTLLNDNLEISVENRKVIEKAQQMGIIFTIATGRMFRSTLPIAKKIGIKGPVITYQGAVVGNVEDGTKLIETSVPIELAKEVIEEGYRNKLHINIYMNDGLYADTLTPEGKAYSKQSGVEMIPVGNLFGFLETQSGTEPTKVLYIGDPKQLDDIQWKMQEKYGKTLYITKSKPYYLEFLHPNATKGAALKMLAEKLGIKREEILAFGDSFNDIEMLKFAGTGVAMGNAPEQIKKLADQVTYSNNENGVAQYIEKHVFCLRD